MSLFLAAFCRVAFGQALGAMLCMCVRLLSSFLPSFGCHALRPLMSKLRRADAMLVHGESMESVPELVLVKCIVIQDAR